MQNILHVEADIKEQSLVPAYIVTQNDYVRMVVTVLDAGEPVNLEVVETFTLACIRPDGVVVTKAGTQTGPNEITFDLGATEIEIVGKVDALIQLYAADGRVSTIYFAFTVVQDPTSDGYLLSANEQTLIEVLLSDGPLVVERARSAATSAESAAAYIDAKKPLIDKFTGEQMNLQAQLDEVARGSTNAETSQARVDTKGNSHTTLKARLDAEQTTVTSLLADISVNIKNFGASESNTAAENTAIIQSVFDSLLQGQAVLIPNGTFKINNLVFNPPNDCKLIFQGILRSSAQGVALRIGDLNSTKRRYVIENLNITSPTRDWTDGRVGVQFANLNEATVSIKRVNNFTENVQVIGINGFGNVHNEYHLGLIMDGKIGLRVRATLTGWANENTFYGGRFPFGSMIPANEVADCIGIIEENGSEGSDVINNNRFMFPSVEGGGRITTGIRLGGIYTYLFSPRMEGAGNIILTSASRYVMLFLGRGIFASTVVDQGARNKVWSRDVLKISGGGPLEDDAVLDLRNAQSATGKVYIGRGPTGNETFYVRANGEAVFSGNVSAVRFKFGSGGRELIYSASSPEGVTNAYPGSIVANGTGGSNQELWVKGSGTGNTGWKLLQSITSGTTQQRPTARPIGYQYFDTTLNKPIWHDGSNWVDATGTVV